MVAVPYCLKCNMKVDPKKDRCPNCGSPVRYRFIRREHEDRLGEEEEKASRGYIRPPSARE